MSMAGVILIMIGILGILYSLGLLAYYAGKRSAERRIKKLKTKDNGRADT